MTLTRNAQMRVWLSRALATHVPGPRFQALHILPQRRSVYTPTLKSRTSETSFLSLKGNPAHGPGFQGVLRLAPLQLKENIPATVF